MKKRRFILNAMALIVSASGLFAYKAYSNRRIAPTLFTKTTGICQPVNCSREGSGVCGIPLNQLWTTSSCNTQHPQEAFADD
jgi:hypothetical protein